MYDIVKDAKGLVAHGVSACAGCGLELIIRNVLDVLGEDTVIAIPPGCSALFCGYGNEGGMKIGGVQCNLENTAAIATGIRAGLSAQGNKHTTVLAFAGDGATIDIGLQSFSGMLERGDRVLYVCYDNEAYMNTGIQSSGSTPLGASTTTTPSGKPTARKNLIAIAVAHGIPYAASASVANIPDLRKKVQKAMDTQGPSLLHIHTPCPTGWGFEPAKSIEVCREAVKSGAWILYEVIEGVTRVNFKPKQLKPTDGYLSMQRRFQHTSKQEKAYIQEQVVATYTAMIEAEARG